MPTRLWSWVLGVTCFVMVEAILLLAIGSAIKRGNEADSLARARTAYINVLTACADRNDAISISNGRAGDDRALRNVVVDFANKAAAARRKSGDRGVALQYEVESDRAATLNFKYIDHITCLKSVTRPRGVTESDIPQALLRRVHLVDASSPPVP